MWETRSDRPRRFPLLQAFAAHCREHDWPFAFFQARPEWLPFYNRMGWRAIHIGEDPVLWTDRFTLEGSAVGELRRSARRIGEIGIEARMFFPDQNPFDAGEDPDGLYEEMRHVSAGWAHAHRGGERGFCMGRFEDTNCEQAWLVVAWNAGARRVEGFISWVPIWARRGWALDLMRRRRDAPNGTMEFLVVRSVQAARERGDVMLSLSLSALASVEAEAGEAQPPVADGGKPSLMTLSGRLHPVAPRLDRARQFLMQHLARYYDFKTLFRWKKKFMPTFEDRYLVLPDPFSLPQVVIALVRAQSSGGLLSYLRRD